MKATKNSDDADNLYESVISHFQKTIIDRLSVGMKLGGGEFYQHEVMITYPAVNLYLHYMGGVGVALHNDNYVVALSSARGMLESLAALIYDGTAKLTKSEYEKFYKKGRFYRKDNEGKFKEVGQRNLIKHMKNVTGFDGLKMYDLCCSYLHFSNKHAGFMLSEPPEGKTMRIQISSKSKIPKHIQKDLLDFCSDASVLMVRALDGFIREREERYKV